MKEGDIVLINYTVKVVEEDGSEVVVDSTDENLAKSAGIYDPRKRYGEAIVIYGKSGLLKAVEEALAEMGVGEKREIVAPPEKAYGPRREDLIVRAPLKHLQRLGVRARVGEEVSVGGRVGVITKVTERFAYIDLNPKLAGKTLKISLELVKIVEDPGEKVRLLASRMLGLDPSAIEASYSEDKTAVLKLQASALGVSDLEARLQAIAQDIYNALEPKKLTVIIEIEYPEAIAKPEKPESQSPGEPETPISTGEVGG
ncbi:MAG: FKBP-type peptidyl-prolyl cis-trans isomerase [Thermoprotei archaeon]|nr:FKBP-type peptidyl-prolyl cis-trans isomerase [Thermoprotei archaeon]